MTAPDLWIGALVISVRLSVVFVIRISAETA